MTINNGYSIFYLTIYAFFIIPRYLTRNVITVNIPDIFPSLDGIIDKSFVVSATR